MSLSFEDNHKKLMEMKAALDGAKRLVILSHDHPDPDGIACGIALERISEKLFQIPAVVRYTGSISRAENVAMVKQLKIKIKMLNKNDLGAGDKIALIDCQPNTGNVSLPKGFHPTVVIDHHPLRKNTKVEFSDIRVDYGATATILSEYLVASAIEIDAQLATALCYAISTETQNLSRGATPNDTTMYSSLFPMANKKILSRIENPELPREYYKILSRALHHAFVYKNLVIANVGEIKSPDFVPIVADLLLKCERVSWSLCMGRYDNKILLSLRTSNHKANAGQFLRALVGKRGTAGGHGMLAGGQILAGSTEDIACDALEKEIKEKFLRKLGHKKDADVLAPLLVVEQTA